MDYTTIVLAGGESKRFGAEKPFIDLCGSPMIHWVLRGIESPERIVVGNSENREQMEELCPDDKVVVDIRSGLGPIGGMYTGLKYASFPTSLVVPCDTPFISKELMLSLLRSLEGHQAIVPRWPNGYIESLHVALKTDATLQAVKGAIDSGKLSVQSAFDRLSDVEFVSMESLRKWDPELLSFFNLNTQEDLKRAKRICELTHERND